MSNSTGMWIPGKPPSDGQDYLCWCSFNYGSDRGIVSRPIVLRWRDGDIEGNKWDGEWEWDDPEVTFWGTIEFHAAIEEPVR